MEAYKNLGVEKIYYLPDYLRSMWSQIPPDIPEIREYIQPIKEWLEGKVKKGDYMLVQGDFGATYQMVKWAFSKNYRPIYATTKRTAVEMRQDEKIITNRQFEHVRFRFYE